MDSDDDISDNSEQSVGLDGYSTDDSFDDENISNSVHKM